VVDLYFANLLNMMPLGGCSMSEAGKTCIGSIENQIKDASQKLGFQCFRYSIRQIGASSADTYSIAVSNFPRAWELFYEAESYYKVDPIVRMLANHDPSKSNLLYGSWLSAMEMDLSDPLGKTQSEKEYNKNRVLHLFEQARTFNLKSGIYFSHGDDKKQTLISMASNDEPMALEKRLDEKFWKSIYALVVLVEYAVGLTSGCDACMQGVRIDGSKPVVLSTMQRRILMSFYNNPKATIKQVAKLNDLTVSTINFHLKAIRKKLERPGFSGHALAQFSKDHNMF